MKCPNCNAELQGDVVFCSNCGTKIVGGETTKRISLKCANCNGTLTVDSDKTVLVCPFCGEHELIIENDAVKIERIRANTQREIEMERIRSAENQQIRAEQNRQMQFNRNDVEEFKKGKFAKILIGAFIVSVIIAYNCFSKSHILTGILAVIQAGCFGVAWCMGMQIIKEVKRYIRIIIAVAGILFFIPMLKSCSADSNANNTAVSIDWNIIFLGKEIPKPNSDKMEIHSNTGEELRITVVETSEEDYYKYIIQCKELGYTIEASETSTSYNAYNDDGYKISLSNYKDKMTIGVDAPTPMSELSWKSHAISDILPAPQSSVGVFSDENDETTKVIIGKTSSEQFTEYINLCKEKGFTVDEESSKTDYSAYNADGYKVDLSYTAGKREMEVTLDNPMTFTDITLPSVGVGALVPEPPSLSGKVGSNYDWAYSVYIENMTKDEYMAYVKKCIEAGFDKDISDFGDSYWADYSQDDEITITVSFEGNNIVKIDITGSVVEEYSEYKRKDVV